MHATDNLAEADRLATICNACRYCEGLCAVFPALEMRRRFNDGDLNYLANLCHNCGACYVDCQFSPPHEFAVNVPPTLAKVRADSWRMYAWPRSLQPFFDRNGVVIAVVGALSVAAFILGFVLWHDPDALFTSSGSFYRLMPHGAMIALFGGVSILVVAALVMSFRNFWDDIGAARIAAGGSANLWQAVKDAGSLRYLDGGGVGCYRGSEAPVDWRRVFHQLTLFGFLFCFAATSAGTIYHYLLGMPAPYEWYQLPKLLGTIGGIGLVTGTPGLLHAKFALDDDISDQARFGMDTAFIIMVFLTGLSGLLLMVLRETAMMGILLALHLGIVLAFFLTMPYSKFVHGLYRFGALVLYAYERRAGHAASTSRGPTIIVDEGA